MKNRSYTQVGRAKAAEETGQRILEAAYEAFKEQAYEDITLNAVAARAGVTLQTVLRRFGSKEQLFQAAGEVKAREIMALREPSDGQDALAALVASYEELGDMNWRMLCVADRLPVLATILDAARAHHRAWIERHWSLQGTDHERRVDLFFAATDFYVWKLLRRDLGRSQEDVLAHMRATTAALEDA